MVTTVGEVSTVATGKHNRVAAATDRVAVVLFCVFCVATRRDSCVFVFFWSGVLVVVLRLSHKKFQKLWIGESIR